MSESVLAQDGIQQMVHGHSVLQRGPAEQPLALVAHLLQYPHGGGVARPDPCVDVDACASPLPRPARPPEPYKACGSG